MIELIFVIVILGILAAVAVPKLSATRDDAQVVSMADSLKTAAGEIVSAVVAQGNADANLTDLSQVLTKMVQGRYAQLVDANTIRFKIGSSTDCITWQKISGNQEVNLTMTYGANTDPRCAQLQNIVNMAEYNLQLQGRRIVQ